MLQQVLQIYPSYFQQCALGLSWTDLYKKVGTTLILESGQMVTVKCEKKHVLDGSPERTCNTDVVWNNEAPLCRKLSKLGI